MTRRIGARYHSVARTMIRPASEYSICGNQEKIARTIKSRIKMLIRIWIKPAPGNIAA